MRTEIPEICLIAPTEELMKKSDKIIRKYKKKVHVYQGSIGNAIELSERLLNQGAQVIISRRGTKKIIEKKFPDQVIDIGLTLADYMPVIEEAAAITGKTAFFSYGKIREDVKVICHMLKIEAEFYSFTNLSDCYHIVEEAVKRGAQLGIGGADTEKIAHDKGLRHLVVENSEESLLRAIEMAEQLLQVKKKEKEKQKQLKLKMERYQLIFNHTHDAIIAVNREGEIDVINDEAKKILKRGTQNLKETEMVEKEAVQDTRLMEVFHTGEKKLNQLMSLNGVLVSANRMPIVVDGKIEGVIATFQDVKAIQDNEQRIRVKLHQRGLIAKYHFTDIIGESKLMRDNVNLAKKFAKSDATILLQGETGTGKELFAQSIHNASRRAEGPFVAVNCGAFPRNLLEAELFGYVEGAFTGASKGGKIGLFEMAHRGTIFLDEIGEMPLETQVQLLRVLQEKEIRRIGSDRVTPVNIRVITATNRNLHKEISKGKFREDLYYRLNVLNIKIPALKERREDICEIGFHLYEQCSGNVSDEEQKFIRRILNKLEQYNWPGNVRELGNLMERIYVLLSQGEEQDFVEAYISSYLYFQENKEDATERLDEWEKNHILTELKKQNLEIGKTAEAMGISRSTLWRKIKKYGIEFR
ncbi:MAG: sigma 54-interacting transcriptional regulator [Clostridiales bacterium]|nr:sigma 54-interacting transcriptional regulator [Clostridiales bacterium]